MHEEERHRVITRIVTERSYVSVLDLVRLLEVSEATIRRDLRELDDARRVRRVRGGAEAMDIPAPRGLIGQPDFEHDQVRSPKVKRAIGKAAAARCPPGSSIILDGGTTVFAMAQELRDATIQILTFSYVVAHYLASHTRNRVMVPGGDLYRDQGVIISPFAEPSIQHFRADLMFLGAQALTHRGISQSDATLVRVQRELLARSERVIVLADSSKFKAKGVLVLAALDEIDVIITDRGLRDEDRALLESHDIEVEWVDVEPEAEDDPSS